MQVSKDKINAVLEKQLIKTFFQLVSDLRNTHDTQAVLSDLLTDTELVSISKRLAIAYWLTKGRSYGNIKNNLKVSSATIALVQQHLKSPGWRLAIQKVTADEWATLWEEKIRNVFKR